MEGSGSSSGIRQLINDVVKRGRTINNPYTIIEDFSKDILAYNSRADGKVKHVV
ncbi:uncharacterized protein PITG_03129 [Phytophthora infestans T30-4]|uniref:Uncharacterized protein n=1 Tax=Phytophthora infestans (strain T30-4) TaxID=403677 RepID=D0MZF9_PHYIT|nr:uncharacterized protein PITG_03129 [Phytophthora infestans T30-4]EEY65622.1 hypothetical protein PITG_03129 [Phytophthora infestans T30-4]|eukprot:XP_002906221.1 hypothetical protein PITG_03129 [Phytophthora infestans T30-4]